MMIKRRRIILAVSTLLSVSVTKAETGFKTIPVAPVTKKEWLAVMGVSSWSMSLSVAPETNGQVRIYAKQKGKPAVVLVDGPVIRNEGNGMEIIKRVAVTIDGLEVTPRQDKLKVGVGVSVGPSMMTNTVVVNNPIPAGVPFMREQLNLQEDKQGRIMLVQGNKAGVSAFPGVAGQDYAIYVAMVPWAPKEP